ncbi:MAG: DUF4124 domain-containing protein [Pseudomonadota bacterium]
MTRVLSIAALLLCTALAARAQSGDVRIYRCTDASGKQTLRDTPCLKGQQEQVREMLRPKDAPVRRSAMPTRPAERTADTQRYVVLAPPQAMYECMDPDGKRYTSANGDGNPRWVPLWTLGDPYFGRPRNLDGDRGSFRPAPSGNTAIGRPQQESSERIAGLPPRRPMSRDWPSASGGGQWIRDTCAMLPPSETCARLRDRRDEIRTRFFNAMPSERDLLRSEERGINARLDNDCGIR